MTICPDCGFTSGDPEPHPFYILCPLCTAAMRERDRRMAWNPGARQTLGAVYQFARAHGWKPRGKRRAAAGQPV